MCLANAEEVATTLLDWCKLFPDGVPAHFTATDGMIDIEASLPSIAKAHEKRFQQWAITKNAEIAEQVASCRIRGSFPLLNALLNNATLFPIE